MAKLQKTLVHWSYSKGNIVIQCSYNGGKTYRYNAFKVDRKNYDARTKSLKPNDELYDLDYETVRMQELFSKVNEAIIHILQTLPKSSTITKDMVDDYIKNHIDNKPIQKRNNLIEDFNEWIEDYKKKKQKEDRLKGKDRKIHPSAKDYISCMNLLKDYEYDEEKTLTINDIDNDFLGDMMEYAFEPRPKIKGEHKYLTDGELENKTMQKRLDSLFAFIKSFYGESVVKELKKPKLEFIISEIVRLDIDELSKFAKIEIKEPHLKKVQEYFLFLCYTGLRWGDFVLLDKTYYNTSTNKLILQAQKTFGGCEIFLLDIPKEIGLKYNFEFRSYTNQAFNRELKKIFIKYDLFSHLHTKTYYQRGRQTITAPKRDFISSHTGRKSFISMLVENEFDVFAIMGMTGHKRVETLRHYVDKFGKKKDEQMVEMNNRINLQNKINV